MSVQHRVSPLFGNVGSLLIDELVDGDWTRFTAIVAFARMSGVQYLESHLTAFTAGGARAEITVGTDLGGTSYEAAWYLMNAVATKGALVLAGGTPGATFHPKIFILSDADPDDSDVATALHAASSALVVIGSANLTRGGLFVNDEASLVWAPDYSDPADRQSWKDLVAAVTPWLDPAGSSSVGVASATSLAGQSAAGRLPRELAMASLAPGVSGGPEAVPGKEARKAPAQPRLVGAAPPPPGPATSAAVSTPGLSVLVARLTFGTSRRWPQWELNTDILSDFFSVTAAGSLISREGVTQAGVIGPPASTPLVIATGGNRRLEFPEPDGRPDPFPGEALLVVVDRMPAPFRYAVLFPNDPSFAAVDTLNVSTPATGQHVAATRRVIVTYAALIAAWPGCRL